MRITILTKVIFISDPDKPKEYKKRTKKVKEIPIDIPPKVKKIEINSDNKLIQEDKANKEKHNEISQEQFLDLAKQVMCAAPIQITKEVNFAGKSYQ